MRMTVVGSGDAFGSGGRLQTCFHVASGDMQFLVDCGASSLIGFHRLELDPNDVETVFISHLHGDHFSGLVWWLLHAQHVARRTAPLTIVGPVGMQARLEAACEVLFPGSLESLTRFSIVFHEFEAARPIELNGTRLTAFEVEHPSGALSAALRLERDGKVLAYSGDTQWVDSLVDCAAGADLFIAECYTHDVTVPYHMNWQLLSGKINQLQARRIMLTHMSRSMLGALGTIERDDIVFADDGLVVDI